MGKFYGMRNISVKLLKNSEGAFLYPFTYLFIF